MEDKRRGGDQRVSLVGQKANTTTRHLALQEAEKQKGRVEESKEEEERLCRDKERIKARAPREGRKKERGRKEDASWLWRVPDWLSRAFPFGRNRGQLRAAPRKLPWQLCHGSQQ